MKAIAIRDLDAPSELWFMIYKDCFLFILFLKEKIKRVYMQDNVS